MHCCQVGTDAISKKNLARPSIGSEGLSWLRWMYKQLDVFKTNLEEYVSKPKQGIWKKNPEFQMQFQDMCATIGVDSFASGKGFRSETLGVGDIYYKPGVLKGKVKFAQDPPQREGHTPQQRVAPAHCNWRKAWVAMETLHSQN
ncbi:hypothetical protein FD755_006566 [Muntiacus reevesi]|uniref:Uncharacterized protein n=1 Tax=Muntiacus reevesi TaxID=9886 RepID=A0A5J5MWW1_MUNRE|nr:hypothetical protein FD755_006566 [Muntiacus reevesi]